MVVVPGSIKVVILVLCVLTVTGKLLCLKQHTLLTHSKLCYTIPLKTHPKMFKSTVFLVQNPCVSEGDEKERETPKEKTHSFHRLCSYLGVLLPSSVPTKYCNSD